MGGKSKAPPPDPNIGIAQKEMTEIARQQLEFAREQYYAEQPRLDRYADLADQFVRLESQAQQVQRDLTADYQQRMQGTFYPIEDTLAFQSLGYYDANPEQQAAIEQNYLAQNQRLVDQRYDTMLSQQQKDDVARRQSFERQLSGLATDPVTAEGLKRTEHASKLHGLFGAAKGQQGQTFSYTPADVEIVQGSIASSAMAQRENIRSLEARISSVPQDSNEYRALSTRLAEAKDNMSKLDSFQKSFSDYLTFDEATGLTLAEKTAQERAAGLQADRERDLSNVGSSLDTVKAYADTYRQGQETAAGRARQDVAGQFDQQRGQLERQMASMGVDPTSGRFMSSMNSNSVMQAATQAQAMNQAREQAKMLGWAQRSDVASMGRGLPGNQAMSSQLASQQGQGGLSAQAGVSGMNQQANAQFMSGLGASAGTWGNVGNLGVQSTQLAQNATNMSNQAKGALTGAIIGGLSQAGAAYLGKPPTP